MPYYTKVLQPDEKVLAIGRLHWSIYLRGLVVLLIGCGVALYSQWLANPDWQRYGLYAGAVIAVVGILMLLAAWLRRNGTEIVVTDRRVIYKRGFLVRRTVEMNVSKIETVDVEQSVGGRIWGYGTLMIRGTGAGFEPLVGIGSPIQIRNAIVAG